MTTTRRRNRPEGWPRSNTSLLLLHAGVLWLGAALSQPAAVEAYSGGIFEAARPQSGSCGSCHGPDAAFPDGAYPGPLVLDLDGLPERYLPGATYELSILVLGPVAPLAGFNLEATGGGLSPLTSSWPEGGTAEVGALVDECAALARDGACHVRPGAGGKVCEVRTAEACPVYGPEHRDCACPANDLGDASTCRACRSDVIVSIQATHAGPATVPAWTLAWTAPSCGFGDVAFYLAGNSVNGVNSEDPGDLWGVFPEPVLVPQALSPACPKP